MYILIYHKKSKYLGYARKHSNVFKTKKELLDFLEKNFEDILTYQIFKEIKAEELFNGKGE